MLAELVQLHINGYEGISSLRKSLIINSDDLRISVLEMSIFRPSLNATAVPTGSQIL